MSYLLHVSDLHLGKPLPNQLTDTHKLTIVDPTDRESSQKTALRTLKRLGKLKQLAEHDIDVVVVTGDLTNQNRRDGFDSFEKLLADSRRLFPKRSSVVVVPGNHDVDWAAPPGSRVRYANFLRATRRKGCVTPLLDDIDFTYDGNKVILKDDFNRAAHILLTDELLVLPINSSNWCGTLTESADAWSDTEWESHLSALDPQTRKEALSQIRRLRQHDMARVSQHQIEALAMLMEDAGIDEAPADGRIRVAAMHHQILPVNQSEEIKTFETLTNLGQVRHFLAQWNFDVVLHGHKHAHGLLWDHPAVDPQSPDSERRVLLVAAPGNFDDGQPVCRLLNFDVLPGAASVSVSTVNGTSAAVQTPTSELPIHLSLRTEVVEPDTFDDRVVAVSTRAAYTRIQHLFADTGRDTIRNLYCEILWPEDALNLPAEYPETNHVDPQHWFDALVEWWQLRDSRLVREDVLPFNHGERVRKRFGDQVDRAARALGEKPTTSRAIIALIDPTETGRRENDERDIERGTYPAFALAVFTLVPSGANNRLDVIGFFRKQEMRYWWPMNVAELARLQGEVFEGLPNDVRKQCLIGRIATFSAVALRGTKLPAVAVAEIDRAVENEGVFWRLALAVHYPDADFTPLARADWRRMSEDFMAVDSPRASQAGLSFLAMCLGELAEFHQSGTATAVEEALSDLIKSYEGFGLSDSEQPLPGHIVSALKRLNQRITKALKST